MAFIHISYCWARINICLPLILLNVVEPRQGSFYFGHFLPFWYILLIKKDTYLKCVYICTKMLEIGSTVSCFVLVSFSGMIFPNILDIHAVGLLLSKCKLYTTTPERGIKFFACWFDCATLTMVKCETHVAYLIYNRWTGSARNTRITIMRYTAELLFSY